MRDFYILLIVISVLVLGVWGYNFYQSKKEEHLKKLAYKVYLYERGKISYKDVIKYVKGTPFYPYLQALRGKFGEVLRTLEDEELRSLYIERIGAKLFKEGRLSEAEKKVKEISEERFNYPSALSLLGFIYEKEGKGRDALGLWAALKKKFPNTYFGKLAEIKLREVKEE